MVEEWVRKQHDTQGTPTQEETGSRVWYKGKGVREEEVGPDGFDDDYAKTRRSLEEHIYDRDHED